MIDVQFKIRNAEDSVIKAMLYISPSVVPNTGSGNIIVGNSIKEAIGGANIDPTISLYAAPYSIRIVGQGFETMFNVDLTNAPTGSVIQAIDYITT